MHLIVCRVGQASPDKQGRQQAGIQRGSSSLFDSLWSHGMSWCRDCTPHTLKLLPFTCVLIMLQVQDKRKELLAGEMGDYYRAEPKVLQADAKAVAVKEWKLLDEEHRSAYQERAAGARLIHACMCCSHFLCRPAKNLRTIQHNLTHTVA